MSALQRFWCHQCASEIRPTADNLCPSCQGEFIEEIEPDTSPQNFVPFVPTPIPQQPVPPPQQQQPFPQQQQAFPFAPLNFQMQFNGGGGADPFAQLMQHVNTVLNQLGQPQPHQPVVFQTQFAAPVHMGMGFPGFQGIFQQMMGPGAAEGVYGDYVLGGNFERIMNQLFEGAHHHGPPPASKTEIDKLSPFQVEQQHIDNNEECAVCKETFTLSDNAKRLPCRHFFHEDCIIPWLKMHNTCPVCRAELRTDDPEYERRREQQRQQHAHGNNRH